MKILAVDDDKIALELLEEALSGCGYDDVTTSQSGAEAFDLILQCREGFDCFLFDVEMPYMNGIDLVEEVRSLPEYDDVPIIMITAKSEKTFIDRAFAAGATDYLTKPYSPMEVGARLGVVKKLSGERRAVTESTDVIELLIKELDKATRHDLDAPIELRNLDRVLSYPAFENYMSELSRGVFHLTGLFAVKLRDVEALHATLPPLEFKEVIRRSAASIVNRLRDSEIFLTYRGNGVFVGIIPRSGSQAFVKLGDELSVDLQADDPMAPPELPGTARLVVGSLILTGLLKRPGSLSNLNAAIASVEKKSAGNPSPTPPRKVETFDQSWPPVDHRPGDQGLQVEYEELLKQALAECDALGDIMKSTRTANR